MRDGGGVIDGEVPDGSIHCTRATDCNDGERCSTLAVCIPESECRADADCRSGRCGLGSRRCLSEPGVCHAMGECEEGLTCDMASKRCVIGGGCGSSEIDLSRLTSNVLILLDRSGSMGNARGTSTRWDIAKEASHEVTSAYDAEIRFGLSTYSSCLPGGCSVGSVVVPLGDHNAAAIDAFLAPLRSRGSSTGTAPDYFCDSGAPETGTGASLAALVGHPALSDPARKNVVLLVTDGAEGSECTDGGRLSGPNGAAALLDQPTPVQTFVVGFSTDVDVAELNRIAAAGGTGHYYGAEDAAMLVDALTTISRTVRSCDHRLDEAFADDSGLYVYFNDDPSSIDDDPTNGWTYDGATRILHFHGDVGDAPLSGRVMDIDVVFGCPGPTIG